MASICAVVFYARYCRAVPGSENRISIIAYVLVLLACAVVAFFIGLQYGIAWACSSQWGGNLCGLVGFFIAGPVAAALAIFFASALMTWTDESSEAAEPNREFSSVCLRLWRGHYTLGRSFWGFFVLGTCVAWIVGIFGGFFFVLYPHTVLIYRLLFLGFLIIAAVGVWRSADAVARSEQHSRTFSDSAKRIAAKAVVVVVSVILAAGGPIELAVRHMLAR